ncbi:hypothetical protein OG875_13440 [Streptomyces sp. NBC_01498]|uniref:hypothetical protein n=1 Tax=Streptomyces sp. NBC_01498 TaxID=2975870 RepID=UPI002E7ADBB7|nr:hypothetical protein [Streptomyces sp. NBC_01498]WTL25505.1 hypothetical protein OG875_13440 [Streptomyces sp. NBC_01498]
MLRYLPLIVGAVCLFLFLFLCLFVFLRFRARRHGSVIAADDPGQSPLRSSGLDLVPAARLNDEFAAPPPPELSAALTAARSGDWRPAAELLAETGADWERRSLYAKILGGAAATDDGWLAAWERTRHDDPDAAVVRARATVGLAWHLRGDPAASRSDLNPSAPRTSRQQVDGFHRTLVRSRQDIARAAALNPSDPTPYITEIWTALGLGYPHAEMDRLWAELTARAPRHYEAHFSALQYWCAKWRGSDELARVFAARAAADAPPGSLMSAFPLIAWFEARLGDDVKASVYRSPELTALVDTALADAAAAPPDHPRLAELRHLLAYFLFRQGRYDAALEQFQLVDGYRNALPWNYYGERFYGSIREATVRRARPVRAPGPGGRAAPAPAPDQEKPA